MTKIDKTPTNKIKLEKTPGIGKTTLINRLKKMQNESEKPDVLYVTGEQPILNLFEKAVKERKIIIWDRNPQDPPDVLDRCFATSKALSSHGYHPIWNLDSLTASPDPSCTIHDTKGLIDNVLKKETAKDEPSKPKK